jgi:hypothetical protein
MATKLDDDALERLFDALSNDHAPHAAVAEPTIPLDADGKPIVVGAFYVWSSSRGVGCGPCLSVRSDGVVEACGWLHCGTSQTLRRVPITGISVVNEYGMLIHDVRSGNHIWQGRLTQEQATKVIECYEAERRAREATKVPGIEPAPTPPPKPLVRCGQRWRLDGVEVELYDSPSGAGLFMARNWDGVRVTVFETDLQERGAFLSGPTVPETKAEAVRRVLELEAANPPDGVGRAEWRARLINRVGEVRRDSYRVRQVAKELREKHAEKWRKFGGGR